MTQTTISSPKQQYSFLQAQIQKINATVLQHEQTILDLQQSQSVIAQQSKKILEMQKKIKLVEVYQHQNFNNNERLFQSTGKLEVLEKRVDILEGGIISHSQTDDHLPFQKEGQTEGEIKRLDLRIAEIQEEIRRLKQKNNIINKFRRQLSPTNHNNCESTKDMSGEGYNDVRALQKKLKQYVNQKLADLPIASMPKLSIFANNIDAKEENPAINLNRRTRLKRIPSSVESYGETAFKKRIDNYYNQTTEPGQKWLEYGNFTDERKDRQKDDRRANNRKKEQKEISKGSKSSKKASKSKRSVKSSDKVNLMSVNEYMRLRKCTPL